MFLFWDLTSPSPPGEGGRKVGGTAMTLWDPLPRAISFSVASSYPLLGLALRRLSGSSLLTPDCNGCPGILVLSLQHTDPGLGSAPRLDTISPQSQVLPGPSSLCL